MAAKKTSRSSKTDHVLSLLAGKSSEEHSAEKEKPAASRPVQTSAGEQAEAPAPEPEQPAAAPARREPEHLAAPILQVARSNEELARTIRGALEQTLEEELARAAAEPQPDPEPPVLPESEPEEWPEPEKWPEPEPEPLPLPELPVQPEAEEPAPEAEEPPLPELRLPAQMPVPPMTEPEPPEILPPQPPVLAEEEPQPAPQPVPEPEPQPEPNAEARPEPPRIPFAPRTTYLPGGEECVNLMELLVDERLGRYVKMFRMCTCSRCMADVRALALTRLPAKYLVIPGRFAAPMLSVYRSRYETDVVAQVILACKTVTEHPRHDQ